MERVYGPRFVAIQKDAQDADAVHLIFVCSYGLLLIHTRFISLAMVVEVEHKAGLHNIRPAKSVVAALEMV